MNRLSAIRREKGLLQTDFAPIQSADISKLECNRFRPTPLQMEIINRLLETTVNDIFDRADLVTFPPTQKSVRRREREKEQDIDKLTIRVPHELASRFRALCTGHTQAEVFEVMLIVLEMNFQDCMGLSPVGSKPRLKDHKIEKDRRPRTRASGQQKNITCL